MSEATLEREYVPQREFDIYIQNIKERADSDKELTAERLDRFEAVIDKKLSEMKNEINAVNITLNTKIDNVEDRLSTAVAGVIDRLDDMKDYQNKWFTLFGILFTAAAIIAPVAVALIQKFVK